MRKTIIFVALLVVFAFAVEDIEVDTQTMVNLYSIQTGGYQVISSGKLQSMKGEQEFQRVEREARQEYLQKYGEELG